ncbi:Serine/threonine-protein kinase/endoribonuclease ire-1 [Artemisia annua]|uniref:Serine/threonine-protein kinase/endoribonuclease ire-1 n=1 Tax=Artemisia annua TaxID=35608 RepID=A0A2U1PJ54_ARTAN|nr:Serine/threonine-protein kinase/endoribonuclease ire-1 [Artemisia annua]
MEMEEENVEVPQGDLDAEGHHLFMIASFDGNCYLVNKQSGFIYWSVPTSGFLRIANRGEDVVDYADLKQGDYRGQLYHFKPNPQLIPYDTKELLEEHFNQHHKGGLGTDVSKDEGYYVMDYQTGKIIHYFDSYEMAVQNDVFENEELLDFFLIKRVDFYLHRSSPFWSLRFARIEAWFPHSRCRDIHRTECLVYHAPNPNSYVQACIDYNLNRFPRGCAVNQLITDKSSLSLQKVTLEEEKNTLEDDISNLRALLSRNSRIDTSLLNADNFLKHGDNGSEFFKGAYDCVDALIEKTRRGDDAKLRQKIYRLYKSAYHPNICTFLGWQSDETHDYFAYEKCRKSFKDYVFDPKYQYKEMSAESLKIMSGLVSGICHLHSRGLLHTNLTLDNIWISDDKNKIIKIGGVGNCKLLGRDEDLRIPDLYEVGEAILFYMTKGNYTPKRDKTTLMKSDFDGLEIKGTNREVLDLLQKLNVVEPVPKPRETPEPKKLCNHIAFWPAPKRLGFFQDLSNFLDDTDPRPEHIRKAINSLTVVPGGHKRSDWGSLFEKSVRDAMEKMPEKKGQPKVAQQDPKQAQSSRQLDPKKGESSKQDPPEETTKPVNYSYTRPVSLIRFMRSGFTHIHSFSSRDTAEGRTLEDDLGGNASKFEETFRTKFPDLFVLVYAEGEKYLKDLPDDLQIYYLA